MRKPAESDGIPLQLRADCASCRGLCCVAHAFDAAQGFGFDKPAHTPCPMLTTDFRCSIHAERAIKGFPGCVTYDCHGAGQRVTRAFRGISWRDSPQLVARMSETFLRVRSFHELLVMLTFAISAIGDERMADELVEHFRRIDALCGDESPQLTDVEVAATRREVMRDLRLAAPLIQRDPPTASPQILPRHRGRK